MILAPYQKPPLGVKLNRSHWASRGLVGCWLMNEGSGNRAWDLSGQGNHGTLTNMAPLSATSGWVGGPHGDALAFDGSNDYVNCGNGPNLNIVGAITVEVLLTFAEQINATPTIASKLVNSSTSLWSNLVWGLGITNNVANTVRFGTDGASNNSIQALIPGNSYQIVFVADGINNTLYINGMFKINALKSFIKNSTEPTVIARRNITSTSYPYTGLISKVSIYNRALSANEIAHLYAFPYCMFEEDKHLELWNKPPRRLLWRISA